MTATRSEQIRIPKAAELVADTLRRRIITGEYAADDLLPQESALMETFHVARTTVRDAFRILESEGLLVVRRGANGGGRVRPPTISMVANYAGVLLQLRGTTLEDVHLARSMIETPVAGMLAARSDDVEMIAALRTALDAEAAAIDDPVELSVAEGRFHQQLVQLAGSKTVELLSAVANRIIAQQVARVVGKDVDEATRSHHHEAHRAHERLVELIEQGNVAEAQALWRRHLESGLEHLLNRPTAAKTVVDVMS